MHHPIPCRIYLPSHLKNGGGGCGVVVLFRTFLCDGVKCLFSPYLLPYLLPMLIVAPTHGERQTERTHTRAYTHTRMACGQ